MSPPPPPPPPPPYSVNDPLGDWPFTHQLDWTTHAVHEGTPSSARGTTTSTRPLATQSLWRSATPSPPRRPTPLTRVVATQPAQRRAPHGVSLNAHPPRPTARAPVSPPRADLQWSIVASVKPASPLPPVYLFSARDMSTPSTWHFGYGSSPTAPEHVLSCRGPSLGRASCATSLDPLQYRYDHIESCYAAHSRVEKLLRAYLKHREDSGCGCSLAGYTGRGLTVSEAKCETIWGAGFRAFFRSQKVRRLIDGHDGCCSCGCLGKREVQYVGGQRLEQVSGPAWCIYGFIP